MIDSQRSNRLFRAIVGQGYHLAFFYCVVGLLLELLYRVLPPGAYERMAGAIYGLPMRLLAELGLQTRLIAAVAQGRIPGWLAAAAVPALGVATILLSALLLATVVRFCAAVRSFRQV